MIKVFVFAAVLLSMSCHQNAVSTSSATGKLEQKTWKLVALDGLTDSLPGLSRIPYMQLDSGRVKGFAGCNNFFGSYTADDKSIDFSDIGSTKMFCARSGDIESALLKALEISEIYRINNNRLELLKGEMVLAGFEEAKQ